MENHQSSNLKFSKEERLRHKALVQGLFDNGEGIYEYPLRLTWRLVDDDEMKRTFRAGLPDRLGRMQMMVTVPKKKRRRAVDRVLIRRRIREAYRLHRLPLKSKLMQREAGVYLQLGFVYISTENESYAKIEKRMKKILSKLDLEIEKRLGEK